MPQIVLDGSGVSKASLIEGAYEYCGLNGIEFERTPEEMTTGLRHLNALMAELPIDLGFDFPTYGQGLLEEPSGIPDYAITYVHVRLAQRLAPAIGATVSEDARAVLGLAYQTLMSRSAATPPTLSPFAYRQPSSGVRHILFGRSRSTSAPAVTPLPPVVVTPPPVVVTPPPAGSILQTLTLSSSSIAEGSGPGTLVGSVLGTSPGSALSLSDDAGGRFVLSGTDLVTGLIATNFEAFSSHSISIVETLSGDPGSPKTTTLVVGVDNVLELTLGGLSGTFSLPENAAAGDIAGAITGTTAGSTIGLVDNAGGRVALSGNNIIRGPTALNFEASSTHSFTIRETHPDAVNSPRDTIMALGVSNVFEQPNLQALSLSLSAFTIGASASGSINNATPGSAIVVSGTLPTGLTINGVGRTWAYNGSGSASSGTFNLIETLSDSANSPRTTTISWSISAAGSFATPVLSLFSTTNTVPVIFSVSDTDYVAGMYGQLQLATDSGFTSIIQDSGAVFVSGAEWAALDAIYPFSDPTGTYYARFRFLRENPGGATTVSSVSGAVDNYDASPWSNTITDTITVSVAKFNSNTGVNKSRWITTTNGDFTVYFNANVGSLGGARATVPAANTKWHAEFRFDSWNSSSGSIRFGTTDGTIDFNAGTGVFGSAGAAASPGLTVSVGKNATFVGIGSSVTLPGGITTDVNDRIIIEGDTSTNILNFYYWDDSAGALVSGGAAIATRTLTSPPATYYVWAGGIKGAGGNPAASDQVTLFPVADKMAYSSGYGMYG